MAPKLQPIPEALTQDIECVYRKMDPEGRGFLTRRQFKLAFLALFGTPPPKVRLTGAVGDVGALVLLVCRRTDPCSLCT